MNCTYCGKTLDVTAIVEFNSHTFTVCTCGKTLADDRGNSYAYMPREDAKALAFGKPVYTEVRRW